jgi:hypothetical protein
VSAAGRRIEVGAAGVTRARIMSRRRPNNERAAMESCSMAGSSGAH